MNWNDIISTIKKLENLSENIFPISNIDGDLYISKQKCFYIEDYTKYSLVQDLIQIASFIDVYVNEKNIRLECMLGHTFIIDFDSYDINLYTLEYGRPPESIVRYFTIINILMDSKINELE